MGQDQFNEFGDTAENAGRNREHDPRPKAQGNAVDELGTRHGGKSNTMTAILKWARGAAFWLMLSLLPAVAFAQSDIGGAGSVWSPTDANNNATPPGGWPSTTMLPNQVEPTARANMGALTRFWQRVNCLVTTTGSAGSYVYTPANTSYPTAYNQGEKFCAIANFTSVGNDKINVNSLGARNIYKAGLDGTIHQISASDILSSSSFTVAYAAALSGGSGGFMLQSAPSGAAVGQTFAGGANLLSFSIGVLTSGTTTISCGNGPDQWLVNRGTPTLAAPTADGECDVLVINGLSSSSLTLSNFFVGSNTGDAYAVTNRASATCTITVATPGVVTYTSHGLPANWPVYLTTTGALPTGLAVGTTYYATAISTNSFELSATPGGSAINTTGSQSGTHTCHAASEYIFGIAELYRQPTYRVLSLH